MNSEVIVGLKLKVMAAQAEYDEASQALDVLYQPGLQHPTGPDRAQAIRSAIERENAAFKKYSAAVKEYSDCMLGKTVSGTTPRLPAK